MLVDELDLRLQPDALDLGPGQVLAQVGEPVDHHCVLAVERHQAGNDALGAAIVVERDLGLLELVLEIDQLAAEEFLGVAAGVSVHLDAAIDIGFGVGVGDARGEHRVGRAVVDLDQAGTGNRPDAEATKVGVYLIGRDAEQPRARRRSGARRRRRQQVMQALMQAVHHRAEQSGTPAAGES